MENTESLNATVRTSKGKGAARQMRMKGLIPAVCYGGNVSEPIHLSVDPKDLVERLTGKFGRNAIFKLNIEGHDASPVVRVGDYQRDPVRRTLIHADFCALDPERKLRVAVPLNLVGRPVGVGKGGKLRQVRRTVYLIARPADIPASLDVDVSGLDLNEQTRVASVTPPEGTAIDYHQNFAVAQVYVPRGATVAAEEEE